MKTFVSYYANNKQTLSPAAIKWKILYCLNFFFLVLFFVTVQKYVQTGYFCYGKYKTISGCNIIWNRKLFLCAMAEKWNEKEKQ